MQTQYEHLQVDCMNLKSCKNTCWIHENMLLELNGTCTYVATSSKEEFYLCN
jgi:hypothetical protein